MILCLNANAAIDKTLTIPGFEVGAIHRPEAVLKLPGGKGLNVARAFQCLGGEALTLGWAGGHAGNFIRETALEEGLQVDFVSIIGESRTCISIYDPLNGEMTEMYESGVTVSASEVRSLVERFGDHIPRASVVTLSGSLPPGVPEDLYAQLAQTASEFGVPVLLDTGGSLLQATVGTPGIRLVKPNRQELQDWLGLEELDVTSLHTRVRSLAGECDLDVVVSLGEEGVLVVQEKGIHRVYCPPVPALSAVGSGDVLMAGLALGTHRGWPLIESVRVGVAAAAANTLTLGAGCFSLDDYERILDDVVSEART
jgi:1-phosphofructokinase family hexose kinase